MFVEATPNDELIKMLRTTEEKSMIHENQRIKFISKTGTKLIHLFQRKDPFQTNCEGNECVPCANSDSEKHELSNCKVNNICYSAKCITCDQAGRRRVYHGETSRNLHIRSKEHTKLFDKKSESSFMYKHAQIEHAGNVKDVNFKFNVIKKFKKPLQRQLFEAQCIENTPLNENLNSKDEFNCQIIKRLDIHNTNKAINCNICGQESKSQTSLEEHNEKFHNRYNCDCDKCEYVSFGRRDMLEHRKLKHNIPINC